MQDVRFFDRAGPFCVADIAGWIGAQAPAGTGDRLIADVAPLDMAGPHDISFCDSRRYAAQLSGTGAGACLVSPATASQTPATAIRLEVPEPAQSFAEVVRRFYPDAVSPLDLWDDGFTDGRATVHPTARLEEGATVEPGAIVGGEARIGRGTRILAGSVIGRRVHIGRDCTIGPSASVIHALVGDRVIVHPGVRIGQDGFGYVFIYGRHVKVPQIGRVVIQDDVEIGANTTIDRGRLHDTVIGEGSKIDNLVQIGHNVVVGRHCVIAGQVGISGSTRLGDYVMIGGQAGLAEHVTIGDGVQLAAQSGVIDDLQAGGRYGGAPAQPARFWAKEMAALRRLAQRELATRGVRTDDE